MPTIHLGDVFPDVQVDSTQGQIRPFLFWRSMGVSHPADFTKVCTTELGRVTQLVPEFAKRNVKLIALSCDSVEDHLSWSRDIQHQAKMQGEFPYPIISDPERKLATHFGMLDPEEQDPKKMPLIGRAVFIIGPDKKLKLSIL